MALAHAILAALTDCPCSGYDLAKRFDGSVGFFWQASHQQIYRELTRLEEQGLITPEVVAQSGRPDKKVYHITPTGLSHFRDWIGQTPHHPPLRDELLVKLFAGHLVSPQQLISLLEQERASHRATLQSYRAIEAQFFSDPDRRSHPGRFQYITLRNGIHYELGWLAWCDETLASLANLEPEGAGRSG